MEYGSSDKRAADKFSDAEYGSAGLTGGYHTTVESPKSDVYEANGIATKHEEDVASQNALFRALGKLFNRGVEARGIEPVPEDERDGKHTIGLLIMWWSVNCVISTFPIGVSTSTLHA